MIGQTILHLQATELGHYVQSNDPMAGLDDLTKEVDLTLILDGQIMSYAPPHNNSPGQINLILSVESIKKLRRLGAYDHHFPCDPNCVTCKGKS